MNHSRRARFAVVGIAGIVAALASSAAAVAPAPGDTARAAAVLATAITAAGESNDSLAECPVPDVAALVAKAPAALGISTAINNARQTSFTQGGATTISCSLFDGNNFGTIFMGQPFPTDLKSAVESLMTDGFQTAFGPVIKVGGGDLLVYCASPINGGDGFCEADWMDANIIYGAAAFSPTVNAQLVGTWLSSILDDLNTALIGSGQSTEVLDTGAAGLNVAALSAAADRAADQSGRLNLSKCPFFATAGDVLAKVPPDVDVSGLDGALAAQYFPLADQHAMACLTLRGGRPLLVVGAAGPPSGDHHALATSLSAGPLTFAPDRSVRGGTLVTYCETNPNTKVQNYCEADWFDGNVEYMLWVGTPDVTADQTSTWLLALLDDLNSAAVTATLPAVTTGTG